MVAKPLPYFWDGKKFHRIHYSENATCGHAWVRTDAFHVEHQWASGSNAIDNLVNRMIEERNWYIVKAIRL